MIVLIKVSKVLGFFIPLLHYRELDRKAIEKNFSLLEKKMKWIKQEKGKIDRRENFAAEKKEYKAIKQLFKEVVDLRQKFHESKKNQANILLEGKKKIQQLNEATHKFLDQISFLKPFGYPVDHLVMRQEYDLYKNRTDTEGQMLKNDILFRRKIFEDGAPKSQTILNPIYFFVL